MILKLIRILSKSVRKETPLLFRFAESENTACITCKHVLNRERPILYVAHSKEDDMWQFLCGKDDDDFAGAKLVSLKNIGTIDETVNDLFEMPLGFSAERKSRIDKC